MTNSYVRFADVPEGVIVTDTAGGLSMYAAKKDGGVWYNSVDNGLSQPGYGGGWAFDDGLTDAAAEKFLWPPYVEVVLEEPATGAQAA